MDMSQATPFTTAHAPPLHSPTTQQLMHAELPPCSAPSTQETISTVRSDVFNRMASYAQHSTLRRVAIEWSNLTYTVNVGHLRRKRPKLVLQDVWGTISHGRLLAILGPSGSGKTSVINALAGRLPKGGTLEGTILVNGQPRTKAFRNLSAYVLQNDILLSCLTVRETFTVAARLRLPSSVDRAEREKLVEQVITELGLSDVADTFVGGGMTRGVSGGERKRTNIGVELIGNPSILFLDEPTSGLDAFQAFNVMSSLWSLAQAGRTVLATVHQPRSSIFQMFDLLMLITKGRMVYFGAAHDATLYFEQQGHPLPPKFNPADWLMDVVSLDYRSPEALEASQQRIETLIDAHAMQRGALQTLRSVELRSLGRLDDLSEEFNFAAPWIKQFAVLYIRATKQVLRDRMPLIVTLMQTLVIGIILGVLYSSSEKNQQGIQNITGLLFFISIFAAFSNLMSVLNTFPAEKQVVNRERASKTYRVSSYYVSKMISEAPLRVVFTLIFASIVYWMAGLAPTARQFFLCWSIIILTALTAQGLGIAVSAMVTTEKLAFALAPFVTIVLILFGGFYINSDSIPVWLAWIKYLSFVYYAFAGLMISQLQGECCFDCENVCNVYNPSNGGECQSWIPAPGCLHTGDQVLRRYGYGGWQLWEAYVGLLACLLVHHCVGYTMLRFKRERFLPLGEEAHTRWYHCIPWRRHPPSTRPSHTHPGAASALQLVPETRPAPKDGGAHHKDTNGGTHGGGINGSTHGGAINGVTHGGVNGTATSAVGGAEDVAGGHAGTATATPAVLQDVVVRRQVDDNDDETPHVV